MIKDRDTTIGYHCPFCGMSILNNINIFSMNGNLIKIKCVCGGSELSVQILKDGKYRITVPCILCPNSHSFTLSSGAFFQKDIFPFTCKFTAINICFIGKGNRVYESLKKNEEELIKTFAAYEEEYEDSLKPVEDLEDLFDDDDFYDDDYLDDFNPFAGFDLDDFNSKHGPKESEPEKEPGFILHKTAGLSTGSKTTEKKDYKADADAIKLSSYQIVSQVLDSISRLYDEKKIICKCRSMDGKIVILGNAVHVECKNCGAYRNVKSANVSDAEYLNELDELYLDFDD